MLSRSSMIVALLFIVATGSRGQNTNAYVALADSAYQKGMYAESASLYAKAIAGGAAGVSVLYNASCSFALSGNKDSAFYYLDKAIDRGWSNVSHMQKDSDLGSLRLDSRWSTYIEKAKATELRMMPIDSLIYHMNFLSAVSYQYRIRPKAVGGGEGSYVGFMIPQKMSSTHYGTFIASVISADTIRFVATSTVKNGSVTAFLDRNGRLSGWIYTGEFK